MDNIASHHKNVSKIAQIYEAMFSLFWKGMTLKLGHFTKFKLIFLGMSIDFRYLPYTQI